MLPPPPSPPLHSTPRPCSGPSQSGRQETLRRDPLRLQQVGEARQERDRPRHRQGQAQALPAHRRGENNPFEVMLRSLFRSLYIFRFTMFNQSFAHQLYPQFWPS